MNREFTSGTRKDIRCLIHLDRLSLTLKHTKSSTFRDFRNPDQIPVEQVFDKITLYHDQFPGLGAYYHTHKVYYLGIYIGKLHTGTKLKKHEFQLDFDKQIFYSFHSTFWYDVYLTVLSELGLLYNNISYLEISIDVNKNLVSRFKRLYMSSINNLLINGGRYKMRKSTPVNIMENGSSFLIGRRESCQVSIYNKSLHAETFITEYFENNDLKGEEVFRIESKMTWRYLRHLRKKKKLDVGVESLLTAEHLASLFHISSKSRISFEDLQSKSYDDNRNAIYKRITIIDDLPLCYASIGKLNDEVKINHYKNEADVDEDIMRKNFYRFVDTGKVDYLRCFAMAGKIRGYNKKQMISAIKKFDSLYKGSRTGVVNERVDIAFKKFSGWITKIEWAPLYALTAKLKIGLLGLFW